MASIYTHDRFGRQVVKIMPEITCGLTNRILFQFGNQGPDLFFFNLNLKVDGVNPGTAIHDRPFKDYLDRNKEYVKSLGRCSDEFYYFAGTICHFILDSYIHPTVEANVTKDYSHMDIEIELDRYYMLKDGKNPHKFKMENIIPEPTIAPKVIHFYDSYGVKLKDVFKSIEDFKKFRKLFHTGTVAKEIFLKSVMTASGKKEFTGQLITHKVRPQAEEVNKVLVEKFDEALENAPRLLRNALDYIYNDDELDSQFLKDYMGEIK